MSERWNAFQMPWVATRRISDSRAEATYRFQGTVDFKPEGADVYLQHEAGILRGPQGCFQAERRYRWEWDGRRIAVFHNDGTFFHVFDPSEPCPDITHECGSDLYLGRYDFRRWPRWRCCWRVRGPMKDYHMVTTYRPRGTRP